MNTKNEHGRMPGSPALFGSLVTLGRPQGGLADVGATDLETFLSTLGPADRRDPARRQRVRLKCRLFFPVESPIADWPGEL
jgi:hypothetical protein